MTAEITLLTQADCDLCEHAKRVLEAVGADHDIHVTEIDLDTDTGRRLAQKARVLFAPGTLLDGEPFGHGRLSERKLRRTLQRRATTPPPATR
ncbi:thioredoxin family protein [Nocardiopsis gilva YIM 90087]|uniref:Thioredoxin family protein n=1 Tax=Nocardiopsis gilva YIM 90087 TaxID=1235441 RepID=A0A223S138_9ACTN|nr:glutaredoxin family protein [Nocardiopsis gilva]ASU81831.1 thioredoxin family protein [Nocardiopsis gilva YIM 90087]